MKDRAKRIAEEIKAGKRLIILILDRANSCEPYLTILLIEDLYDGLVQGIPLAEYSIDGFKEWVRTSTHEYNNEIRKLIAELL